jgi:hypothetical protein
MRCQAARPSNALSRTPVIRPCPGPHNVVTLGEMPFTRSAVHALSRAPVHRTGPCAHPRARAVRAFTRWATRPSSRPFARSAHARPRAPRRARRTVVHALGRIPVDPLGCDFRDTPHPIVRCARTPAWLVAGPFARAVPPWIFGREPNRAQVGRRCAGSTSALRATSHAFFTPALLLPSACWLPPAGKHHLAKRFSRGYRLSDRCRDCAALNTQWHGNPSTCTSSMQVKTHWCAWIWCGFGWLCRR